jgi:hypothetical protein
MEKIIYNLRSSPPRIFNRSMEPIIKKDINLIEKVQRSPQSFPYNTSSYLRMKSKKLDEFVGYFENTWLIEKCHFDRKDWNLWERYSSRTNNLSETYNHKINGQVIS